MGGRGGGGGSGGGGGVSNANAGVPASSRKVVQGLKEIVNCSDLEIYAMLVECDMDPDETVNRLLSQDTFHEVKSKRDKKKENKDPAESWTRIPSRGARSGGNNDSYNSAPRGGGNRFNSNETGNRRENGARTSHWSSSSSTPGVLGRQPQSYSDHPTSSEVKKPPTVSTELVAPASIPTPAYQSAWVNANPGQRTMADIVKMGRPLHQKNVALPRSSQQPQETGDKAPPLKDEWPSIEPSSSSLKPSAQSQHLDEESREAKANSTIDSPPEAEVVPPVSVSSRDLVDNDSRESSVYEDDESNKAIEEDVTASVGTGFQQLAIEDDEDPKEEDKPAVIIPNHLQVHTSECSHLMFGSFGAGIGSNGLNDNLEEPHDTDFYREEEEEDQLRNAAADEQTSYQIDSAARNYHHASSESETEAAAQQHEQPSQEDHHQYNKFSSSADYGFENNPPAETNPQQMQNLDTFPNVMQQGYTSSLPNSLLPGGIQDVRESDLRYSPFPTKYNNNNAAPSSHTGPAISMAEALRAASISPQNAMPGGAGQQQQQQQQQAAALAQHLALNPYSHHQPGLPLAHYGNLISYPPFLAQSYNPYLASAAFQQAFPAGNHHQSLAGMLPQYKTQSTAAPPPTAPPPPSAYGFGGGASSNNFALNPTSAANSYEDVLASQFKDSNHLASSLQQQNESSPGWHQGQQPNSRVVQGSGYYSFPGHQNQQPPGYRQAQQLHQQHPSQQQQQQQQHFGGHGYVSPYHSQAAMSLDQLHHQHQQQQQQQNARDASKQNQQQLWPNNY